jgi:6-phosphogluconolactonase (cycloisomerase 2 family)
MTITARKFLALTISLLLASCGGSGGGTPATFYTIGGTVTGLSGTGLVLQNNGGDNKSISANGAFTFTTSLVAGANYSVSVLTQPSSPTQICTVSSGIGSMGSANLSSVTVNCTTPPKLFAYVTNKTANTVSTYSINSTTGALTAVGSAVATGTSPTSIAVHPTGGFAYVVNSLADTISTYSINASTGALSVVGSPVATGTSPLKVIIEPTGAYAYVANLGSNNITIYSINQSTGVLTATGSTGTIPANLSSFDFNADTAGNIYAGLTTLTMPAGTPNSAYYKYTINLSTGALTSSMLVQNLPAKAVSIALSPTSNFLYTANAGNNSSVYDIGTGTAGTSVAAGNTPSHITIDPSGKFAYVSNQVGNNVSIYSIHATTGALTAAGTTASTGTSPVSVTTDPTGKFLYLLNNASNDISVYSINATTGALSFVETVSTGNVPQAIMTVSIP